MIFFVENLGHLRNPSHWTRASLRHSLPQRCADAGHTIRLFDTTELDCLFTVSENVLVGPNVADDLAQTLALGLRVFPNPVSAEFFIEMDLPHAMEMRLEVLDVLGRQVAVVSENEVFPEGKQQVKVDACTWPPGVFLLQFKTGDGSFSKKNPETVNPVLSF